MISGAQFKKIFPACPTRKGDIYLPFLVAAMTEAGITTRMRAAAFLAQLGHESLDFKFMEEIASGSAYEGRRDLGNYVAGDGRRFKGRGPIQTTGRLNYTRAGIALKLPLVERPEMLSEPQHGFRAAAFFWKTNKLNARADALTGRGDARDLSRFDMITRRINGGYNGRVDRQRRYLVALSVLTDEQFARAAAERAVAGEVGAAVILEIPSQAQGTHAQPPSEVVQASTPAAPAPPAEPSLLDEIPVNETTKGYGKALALRVSVRAARPLAILWAALEAGNVYAIAGVVVALLGLGYLAYVHRAGLGRAVRWLLRKFK